MVHPGAGNPAGTLVNALLRHCDGALSRAGGGLRPGIVHRLDKDTSGLIVAAKTDRAYIALVEQFASHSIERGYHAIVRGVPRQPHGRIAMPIGRSPANRKKMATVTHGGKVAATDYRLIRAYARAASLVECRPLTGTNPPDPRPYGGARPSAYSAIRSTAALRLDGSRGIASASRRRSADRLCTLI